ncbi:unnamed protein product [Symbiodinium microadriaticum]|nr:unnamed protein product [Symbiodinium microadriaticum]
MHVSSLRLLLLLLLPLASGLVAESCGVSRPLFKDASVKVDPIEGKGNWLQQGLSAVLGWVVKIPLPFLPGAPVAPAQPKRQEGLRCLMPYLMNCTHWHELSASRPCPRECPFIAQVKPFACAFTCVNVTQCRYTDPNMGFANPITQLCEESPIEGCEIQAGGC